MKFIHKILFPLLLISFYGCEKVIELDLRESDKKYVIEGKITNESNSGVVYITETKRFNEDNHFPGVSGAVVTIKDNGTVHSLTESAAGIYQTPLTGIPGHIYELSVTINNQVFTATCTMPQPVVLDTLYISKGPFGQFKFASVSYSDPAGINNGYRFIQYLNGRQDPRIFWENDEFTDGEKVTVQLDTGIEEVDDPRAIKPGDEVTIELLSLDDAIYKYWYSMRSGGADGYGNTAAPANPLTNIKGGALGYFSAHTLDSKTVIAP